LIKAVRRIPAASKSPGSAEASFNFFKPRQFLIANHQLNKKSNKINCRNIFSISGYARRLRFPRQSCGKLSVLMQSPSSSKTQPAKADSRVSEGFADYLRFRTCEKSALSDILTWADVGTELGDRLAVDSAVQEKLETAPILINSDLNSKISHYQGDITALDVDAIVNAANDMLLAGGGVCGAIFRGAGANALQSECGTIRLRLPAPAAASPASAPAEIARCPTGHTAATRAFKLPARAVLHTVGPTEMDDDALAACYTSVLDLCRDYKLRTVAVPCVSTGIFGFPSARAARVALGAVRRWLDADETNADAINRIIFCTFLEKDVEIYDRLLPYFFPHPSARVNVQEDTKSADAGKPSAGVSD
jgi:O-acetyl-ADP-ribose deacetylase (regulator of RNase III)